MTTELNTIKFLHILFAAAMAGGAIGVVLLFLRARRASDDALALESTSDAIALNRWLATIGGALAGILGFILMLRYDAEGIFDAGKQTWIHISILLWLISLGLAGFIGVRARRAITAGGSTSGRTVLADGLLTILVWANAAIAVVIIYFMVFQPFVRD